MIVAALIVVLLAIGFTEVTVRRARWRVVRSRRLAHQFEDRVLGLEADLRHAKAQRDHLSEELDLAYGVAASLVVELRARHASPTWSRTDAESLIASIEADLAAASSDPDAAPGWRAGWDAAIGTYGEATIEVLRDAIGEVDRMAIGLRTVTSDRDAVAARAAELEQHLVAGTPRRGAPVPPLDTFFDGEVSTAQADAFREHLATCERCQQVLHGRMQEQVAVTRSAT